MKSAIKVMILPFFIFLMAHAVSAHINIDAIADTNLYLIKLHKELGTPCDPRFFNEEKFAVYFQEKIDNNNLIQERIRTKTISNSYIQKHHDLYLKNFLYESIEDMVKHVESKVIFDNINEMKRVIAKIEMDLKKIRRNERCFF